MKKLLKFSLILTAVLSVMCIFSLSSSAASGKWITTWSLAPVEFKMSEYDKYIDGLGSINTRTVVTPSASGEKIRVKFSNYYGEKDLVISSATVAYSDGESSIDTSSLVSLTFGGSKSVTIAPGKEIYSDEVAFNVKAMEDIAVSLFIKEISQVKTAGVSGGTTYICYDTGNDYTKKADFNALSLLDVDDTLKVFLGALSSVVIPDGVLEASLSFDMAEITPCLTSVEVYNGSASSYSVVVIGDTTVSNKFPKHLADYIVSAGTENVGISGKGIIGNRLVGDNVSYGKIFKSESLTERFKRDVLGLDGKNQSNVKYVIIKAGAHDIIDPVCDDVIASDSGILQPTAEEIIESYKRLFTLCHDNSIKVVVIGITQFKGATMDYFGTGNANYNRTAAQLATDWKIAQKVNEFLASTDLHDGYVDVNGVSASSEDATYLASNYTTDGLNPTDKLAKIWARDFNKELIGVGKVVQSVSLSSSSKTVHVGESTTLKATVKPSTADNKKVKWTSSNIKVATVNSSGKVTAVSNGVSVITATTQENGFMAKCVVTVKTKPTSITLKREASTIYTTQKTTVTATVLPATASYQDVKWTSSNTKIAKVSSKGVVTGVGKGTVTITATSTYDSEIVATCKIKVLKKVSVEEITLNKTSTSRYKGTTYTLKATVLPENATFKDVTWSSSDTSIVTVDENGKITAKKAGTAIITCTSADNPLSKATCKVKVKIKTTGVSVKEKTTMYVGQQITLTPTVTPSDASNKKVTWKSSDKSIATVDSNGNVTAKKKGTAVITCTTDNGGYTDTCTVTVNKYVAVKKIALNKNELSIKDGKTYTLKVTFTPSNASNQKITWSSSDTSIAKVSSKGVITAKNPGTCKITAKSEDTGKTVKCTVTVKKVSVKDIEFEKSTYKVDYKGTLQLKAVITPSNASNQKIKWTSSNTSYAKVSSKGVVTGLKMGKSVTITATTVDGKKVATCKVKIIEVPVTGLSLNKTSVTLYTNRSASLTATVKPSNASNKSLTWKSSDTSVAKVSSKGVITALSPGRVVITCKTSDGGYTAYCTVVVKNVSATGVYLDNSSVMANKGAVFYLIPTVTPSTATNKDVTWSSSNTSVATVSASGKVTTVGTGVTYVTVKTKDGGYTAKCKITVV